jgi:hypothetical protein
MTRWIAAALVTTLCIAGAQAQSDVDQTRSYTARYTDGQWTYRTTMFPHEIDGCKRMLQSRRSADGSGQLIEREGADCNCDLLIDGMEGQFQPPPAYGAEKMQAICLGPGVDGSERRLRIMRESLKENPDYSDIGQDVRG